MRIGAFFAIGLLLQISAAAVGEPSKTQINAWQRAVTNNQTVILEALLPVFKHAVDWPDKNGKTALMAAARQGDSALAARLIKAGADVNARNSNGGTPLIFAAAGGERALPTLRQLLSSGAALNAQAGNGWTALTMAAVKDHRSLVAELLTRRANPNLADVYGWTPLMRAVFEGRTEIVEALLSLPAIDLEKINDQGQTALHIAVIQRRVDLAQRLLQQGAGQRADFAGYTPQAIAQALAEPRLIALLRRFDRR